LKKSFFRKISGKELKAKGNFLPQPISARLKKHQMPIFSSLQGGNFINFISQKSINRLNAQNSKLAQHLL